MRPALLYIAIAIAPLMWGYAHEVREVFEIGTRYQLGREVVLDDGTRVDLMSPDYAIEVDWSDKWAEAIGQSLHYAGKTDRMPGIVLIKREETRDELHEKYVGQARAVCEKTGITLWTAAEGSPLVERNYPPDPFREPR